MFFSLEFAHGPTDCPAAHKDWMDGFGILLSAENLKKSEIRLLEGFVDNL
ncbi:MAG: hypothetical protein HYS61_09610 [Acidobacteria bacterium]|nr:hypothetical protein [Acidobacteriota bacterium]